MEGREVGRTISRILQTTQGQKTGSVPTAEAFACVLWGAYAVKMCLTVRYISSRRGGRREKDGRVRNDREGERWERGGGDCYYNKVVIKTVK